MNSGLLRALLTVSGLTLLSRVAGFLRDVLAAAILGAGPAADAFFVALKLPNFFRRLFAEGALSVSFVPVYAATLTRQGREPAIRLAEDVLAVLTTALVALVAIALPMMPWILAVLAPGFDDRPEVAAMAISLSRITFLYLLLISLAAFLGGVLNAHDRFAPFAAAPILLNVSMIAALLLAPILGEPARLLAFSVTLGGVAQLVWMGLAAMRAGLRLHLRFPRLSPEVRRIFRLMVPGAIGAGVMQVNAFFDVLLATLAGSGAVSYLYYADRLYQLPLGLVGIALGTALLPMLAADIGRQDEAAVRATLTRAIEFGLLLALAAGIGLLILAGPVIDVLFRRGAFTQDMSDATSAALMAYSCGIPAFVLVKILASAFFARQDTAGPVRIAILITILNILLSLALIGPLAHVGIALATAVTSWLNAALLALGLVRRGWLSFNVLVTLRMARLLGLVACFAVALLAASLALEGVFAVGGTGRALALMGLILGSGLIYLGLAFVLGLFGGGLRKRPVAATASLGPGPKDPDGVS